MQIFLIFSIILLMKRLISFFPNKKPSAPAKYAGAKGISSRYHPDSA